MAVHSVPGNPKEAHLMGKILAVLLLAVIAIQFVPYGRSYSNPPAGVEPAWDRPQTRELFFRACGDCHSHQTRWPWYSRIAPVSWLVQHDVDEGREHFNVSLWGVQNRNKGDEAAQELHEGEMPPWFYLLPHPEAKLSPAEKKALIEGLAATFSEEERG